MRRLSRFLLLSLLVSLALPAMAQTTRPAAPSPKADAKSATISADAFELGEDVEEDTGVITVLGEVPYPGPLVYSDRLSPVEYLLFAGMNPAELDITRVLVGSATGEAAWLTPTTMLLGGERLLVLSAEQAEQMQADTMPLAEPDAEGDAVSPAAPILPQADDESGVRVSAQSAVPTGRGGPCRTT